MRRTPMYLLPAALALCLAPAPSAQITLPATIDDATFGPLRSGNTYIANGSVTVPAGTTLTIEPGVVVKFAVSPFSIRHALFVDGTLQAVGTAQQPIHFTAANDNSVGVAIGSGSPMPGDWLAVKFRSGSDQSVLEHAVLRYGGRSIFLNDRGIVLVEQSAPTIRNCTVELSLYHGILLDRPSRPTIQGCTINDNVQQPLGPRLSWAQLRLFSDNTAARNQQGDHVVVEWSDFDVPTRIDRRHTTNGVIVLTFNEVLNPGESLTLGPDLIIKFRFALSITASAGGNLVLDGQGHAPIVLTSFKDDEFGGDTNLNGPSSGGSGDWVGLRWRAGSQGYANHVRARFPGAQGGAGFYCESGAVAITSARVDHGLWRGFEITALQGIAANWIAFSCRTGIRALSGGWPIYHATLTGNTGAGVEKVRIRGLPAYSGEIANSISYNNGGGNYPGFIQGRLFFCNGVTGTAAGPPGLGNLNVVPMFVDPQNGDLHLDPMSLCVGKGEIGRATLWGVDHDGNSRILDHALNGFALPDMGAYEVAPLRMDIQGVPRIGTTMDFTVTGQSPSQFPNAFSLYLFGLGSGGFFAPPFGVLIAGGPSLLIPLQVLPLGATYSFPIDDQPSWVGTRFGIQALTITQLSPVPAGNLTNGFLASITR